MLPQNMEINLRSPFAVSAGTGEINSPLADYRGLIFNGRRARSSSPRDPEGQTESLLISESLNG
jgi:hypothetical protein